MKQSALFAFLFSVSVLAAADAPQAQVDRGRELFLHSSKGMACATCHQLEGKGTAVGPDLMQLAAVVGPRAMMITIRMTMTAYVQEVKLQSGRTFPGIPKEKHADMVEIYDVSQKPPMLEKFHASDIKSMNQNSKWTHPPTSAGYSDEELADIISYLKFAGTGKAQAVSPGELK